MTAVGAASPTAQGHAITSTLMPNSSANTKSLLLFGCQSVGYAPFTPAGVHEIRFQRMIVVGSRGGGGGGVVNRHLSECASQLNICVLISFTPTCLVLCERRNDRAMQCRKGMAARLTGTIPWRVLSSFQDKGSLRWQNLNKDTGVGKPGSGACASVCTFAAVLHRLHDDPAAHFAAAAVGRCSPTVIAMLSCTPG